MKTMFMTITGGFVVRNMFATDAFKRLKSNKNLGIVVFVPFVNNRCPIADLADAQAENVIFEDFGRYDPNVIELGLKRMADLVFYNTISYTGTAKLLEIILRKSDYRRYLVIKLLKKVLGKSKSIITLLEKIDILLSKYKQKKYKEPFEKYKPSLVFTTDFVHPYEWNFIKTARLCGVPVISMNANWDHFTKGRLPKVDKVIVWDEFNRRQLIEYYGHKPENILIAGIPHQDHFVRSRDKFLPKGGFLRSIGAPEDKKLITYTTARATRDEEDIIEIICEAMKNGKVKYPAHLHVRVHPKDIPERYEKIREKYEGIVTFERAGRAIDQRFWSTKVLISEVVAPEWCPSEEDMIHYANLLSCSDVVINVASSVTLDAAALDVPIINLAFDGYTKKEFVKSNARYFMHTHYEIIPKSGGARIARDAGELIKFINEYLENPKLDSEGRKKIVEDQCGKLDGKAGERIAEYVLNFLETLEKRH